MQGATSLLGGLALLLTPLPLLLYIHGGKLREHVRQRKELAAAEAAAKASDSPSATPNQVGKETAIGARIPPGGAVERQSLESSVDASLDAPTTAART